MDQGTANAAGTLAGVFAVIGIAVIVMWVMIIIAHWKMFEKAGEKGWKSLIPIYSDYTLFKLVWNTKSFWVYAGLILLAGIVNSLNGSYAFTAGGQVMPTGPSNPFLDFLGTASYIVVTIAYVVLNAKTAIAYGKGIGFAFGLVLLPNIFTLIIGFGKSEYRGPAI